MKKIKMIIKDPKVLLTILLSRGIFKLLPDRLYLSLLFRLRTGERLNLKNPITYNEKIQWLKLNDRNPVYTQLVDKYEVKKYIEKEFGQEYLIPLIGVWNTFDEIDFSKLPNQFVLKCTHDSGGVIICKDKSKLDLKKVKKKLDKCLKRNYFYLSREWPYKQVIPRIICEEFIDNEGKEIDDFKIMCFNGEPRLIQHHQNRTTNYTLDFYDINWNKTDITQGVPNSLYASKKPDKLNEMLEISKKISDNTSLCRVDFYYLDNKIYFGEVTYYPTSGFTLFENKQDDILIGSWINLN